MICRGGGGVGMGGDACVARVSGIGAYLLLAPEGLKQRKRPLVNSTDASYSRATGATQASPPTLPQPRPYNLLLHLMLIQATE
jgi:hypothetical protein